MQGGYRYATRVSWCWTWSFPYGKDYSNKDHLHALEVCPMSAAKEAHCIISYRIVSYRIIPPLLFSVSLFGLTFARLLPAHSDFPVYVNLHGPPVHESLGVLLLLLWLFALPISMKVGLLGSSWTSRSLSLVLSHSSSLCLSCSTTDLEPQMCLPNTWWAHPSPTT